MTTTDLPAGMPAVQGRPGSIGIGEVYGSQATAVPTTIMAGSVGGGRVQAATVQLDAEAPVTVQGLPTTFLERPAGVLLVMVAGLAIASYLWS